MASGRWWVILSAFVFGMIASSQPMSSATRDSEPGGLVTPGCINSPCADGCWCSFDQWQEARLLKFGYGMTADRKAAAYWYRRAADKGDARAAFNYGLMLIHGIGTAADPETGMDLVEAAASASVQEAWFEWGNLHRLGEHVAIDFHAAVDAYRRAAERGHVRAQHALGNMYGNGQGVGTDLVTAWKWWRLAARKGHELAGHSLRFATSMMTSAEIGRARRAAEDWIASRKRR